MIYPRKHLLAMALVSATSVLAGCWSGSSDDELKEILQLVEQGKIRSAEVSAKGLLQEAQQDQDLELQRTARLILARLYYDAGDNQNAARFYDAIPTRVNPEASEVSAAIKPTEDDWHRWLLAAWWSGDRKLSARILSELDAPFSPAAKDIFKIRQLYAEDRASEAQSVLLLTDPPAASESPYVRYQYAQLITGVDRQAALEQIDELLTEAPDFANAILLRARLRLGTDDSSGAIEDLVRYTELKPRDNNTKIMAAMAAYQLGESDAATGLVNNLSKVAPKHPAVLQLRAMQALKNNDIETAGEFAEESFGKGNESFINRLIIGVSAYQSKSWELANRHLSAINDRLPSSHFARKMLVEVKLQLDDSSEAAAIFEDLDTSSLMDVALANRVSAKLIQQGGFEKAGAVQDKIADIDIDEDNLLQQKQVLSQALKRNEFKQALIDSVSDQSAEAKDRLRLTLLYLADGEQAQAKELTTQWLRETPNDVNALNASAMVALQSGNSAKVQRFLDQALAQDPDNIPSLLMTMNLQRLKNDWAATLKTTEHLIDELNFINPAVFAHWLESNKRQQTDYFAKALRLVTQSNDGVLEGIYLNQLLQLGRYEDALSFIHTQAGHWGLKHHATAIIAHTRMQSPEKAKASLLELINSDIYNEPKAAVFAASAAARLGDYDLVLNALDKANQAQLAVPNGELMAATAYIRTGRFDEAEARLAQRADQDADYYEVVSDLQVARNQWREAWTSIKQALDQQATPPRLFKAHAIGKQVNQMTAVKTAVRDYFKQQPQDLGARRLLSQSYLQNDPRFAIELLDDPAMSEVLKTDWITTNNLAWLYHQVGNKDKARQFAEHAIAHAPDRPEVIDTYETVFGKKPGA